MGARRRAAVGGGAPWRSVRLFACALGAALLGASPALAQDVELRSFTSRWRAEFEMLDPKGADDLLVGGLHYDFLDPFPSLPGLYLGLGGFAALAGDRSGYMVAGATVGWRRSLDPFWTLDLGQFIGGGGDLNGVEGSLDGGLYLRPHFALERRFGRSSLRFEVSHVNSSGGDIVSTQVAVGIQGIDEWLTADYSIEDLGMLPANAFAAGRLPLSLGIQYLRPSSRARHRDGTALNQRILLATFGLEHDIDEHWYMPFEIAGALAGNVAGYSQVTVGLGYREPLYRDILDWRLQASVGAAGGGEVDTDGGLLISARTGLEARVSSDWRVHLLGGYATSLEGDFDATTISAGASWTPVPIGLRPEFDRRRLAEEGVWADDLRLDTWTVQEIHKSYSLRPETPTKGDGVLADRNVHMLGLGAEKHLYGDLDLSLRAFAAYEGDLGGYHEGQVGLRYKIPIKQPIETGEFYVQYHLGTGGGGGASVGSGMIHNFTAGWRWRPTRGWRFGLEAGHVEARGGDFDGDIYAATLSMNLTRPLRAH